MKYLLYVHLKREEFIIRIILAFRRFKRINFILKIVRASKKNTKFTFPNYFYADNFITFSTRKLFKQNKS